MIFARHLQLPSLSEFAFMLRVVGMLEVYLALMATFQLLFARS